MIKKNVKINQKLNQPHSITSASTKHTSFEQKCGIWKSDHWRLNSIIYIFLQNSNLIILPLINYLVPSKAFLIDLITLKINNYIFYYQMENAVALTCS